MWLSVAGFEIGAVNVNWFKSPSSSLLSVSRLLFCCGSLLLVLRLTL